MKQERFEDITRLLDSERAARAAWDEVNSTAGARWLTATQEEKRQAQVHLDQCREALRPLKASGELDAYHDVILAREEDAGRTAQDRWQQIRQSAGIP